MSRLISSDGGERKTESRVRAWVRQTGTCLTFLCNIYDWILKFSSILSGIALLEKLHAA